jgi:hypothetical protein
MSRSWLLPDNLQIKSKKSFNKFNHLYVCVAADRGRTKPGDHCDDAGRDHEDAHGELNKDDSRRMTACEILAVTHLVV